jgi:epoxyqueuosine reductase QueG
MADELKEIRMIAEAAEDSGQDGVTAVNLAGRSADDRTRASGKRAEGIAAETVRTICLEAGAYDAGFVEFGREALERERGDILRIYPRTQSLISLVCAMNRENIRSPARYLYADEINRCDNELARVSRDILRRLNQMGIRGVAMTGAFPMDMSRYPGKNWDVSHKTVAVEAGLGHMGMNRLVIHPNCGDHILLSSLLIDAKLDQYGKPLATNPCSACRLCVAVCPVGAIHPDGSFDLMACMTHSYRDNTRGFLDWIDAMISSEDMAAYRGRFRDCETASLWQSLMYKLDYKCGYCMAVCPAGEDLEAGYRNRKQAFIKEVFKPLKNRAESIYVIAGSKAESRASRNPNKEVRQVGQGSARKS